VRQTNEAAEATYIHRFLPPTHPEKPPLLLLHRTGGGEDDLIGGASRVSPGSALIALRGNVLEDGKPRFFRRLAKGEFDIDDLKRRTDELARFIDFIRHSYNLAGPIAFAFSNGANIAWSLILRHPGALAGAILMRPYLAYDPRPALALGGIPVLVIAGRTDMTVLPERARELPQLLNNAGARASLEWVSGAHDYSNEDEEISSKWMKGLRTSMKF
jgi:phospholipase/carboxylesterase